MIYRVHQCFKGPVTLQRSVFVIISLSKVSIVGSLRDREVACSASDRQGSNFESCVWRTVSSQSSHHPQAVFLAQFSLYVHEGGLKPDSLFSLSNIHEKVTEGRRTLEVVEEAPDDRFRS